MKETVKDNGFLVGAILAILGFYQMLFQRDLGGGFVLLGLGVAFMSAFNSEFRKRFFNFVFSVFTSLWNTLSRRL